MQKYFAILFLLASITSNAEAATRLGLHVTQEELNIWRQRKNDNVNGIGGRTYQSMWNSVVNLSNGFTSASIGSWNPRSGLDGTWSGATCFPDNKAGSDNSHSPGFDQGKQMLGAAFVAMVNNDAVLAGRVKTYLLNHANDPLLDLSNRTAWCITNYDGVMIRVAPWFSKNLHAYDYLRIGGFVTNSEKVTIESWLNKAGTWMMEKTDSQIKNNAFPNRPNNYSSCTGSQCGGTQGILYYGGPTVWNLNATWNNRISAAVQFWASLGELPSPVITLNPDYHSHAKWFVKEHVQFAQWNNGTVYDTYRWRDSTNAAPAIGSSWTHAAYEWGPLIVVADHQARSGDTELYNYRTSNGLQGTNGPNPSTTLKSILQISQRYADMASGVVKVYGTTNSSNLNDSWWIRPMVESGHGEDYISAMGNIFWKDSKVKNSYNAIRTVADGCGGFRCFGAPWGIFPHILFMFGNMENIVNPYSTTVTPPSSPPTNPPPPASTKFVIGDHVSVINGPVNVRLTPGGILNGTQVTSALGTVIGGPIYAELGTTGTFHFWWNINYDNGADGWSGQDQLVKVTTGDLNGDSAVNSLDWSIMNSQWLTNNPQSDLNKDGMVNSLDFALMNANWVKTI